MLKKLLVFSLFTLSCFAANPGRKVLLDTRPTLNLNPQAGSALAQRFALQKPYSRSTGTDLSLRAIGSFCMGFAAAGALGLAIHHKPQNPHLWSGMIAGITIPLACFTFYPGKTKYDDGTIADWTFITIGRGLCNYFAFVSGLVTAANSFIFTGI